MRFKILISWVFPSFLGKQTEIITKCRLRRSMWSAVEKMPRWKPRRDAKNTKIIKKKKSVIYH